MEEVNILEHIDETGNFKDSLHEHIPNICGEEFKDSKLFRELGSLKSLFKTCATTKKAYDTKMEGVIKQPAEDASDEEKAEFKSSLHKILGKPDKADDYEFAKPEDMPEGLTYDENAEKSFREMFHKHGLSKDTAKEIVDAHNQVTRARFENAVKLQNDAFEKDSTELKGDWKGDSLIENTRMAYRALNEFADDKLKAVLKEAKIYDNAGDLAKWKELNINPYQLRIWANIGRKMKSPEPGNEGGAPQEGIQKLTTQMYDHPTSKQYLIKT